MNPCRPESCLSADGELHVSDELRRGRQAATELLGLIRQQTYLSTPNAPSSLSPDPATGLVMRIIDSFSNSLSMLGCQESAPARGPSESNKNSSSSSGGRKCVKPRRGDYTWTQVTSTLVADGYAWRKYGQKPILNAKHPRNYFKCTNSPHCQALKRVQQMDDDPPMYKITCTGHHTCENLSNPSSLVNDMASSIMVNFEMSKNDEKSNSADRIATDLSPPQFRRVKEEESKNHQPGSSYSTHDNLPIVENVETAAMTSPKDEQWSSLDDFDYLIGSLEFNEDASS
uniref:WRKY domain-containing protein n=1 Tax=Kalanchoe fedtschenkoi TaxID=63787 RepID=A0A7N0T6F3_KALFE